MFRMLLGYISPLEIFTRIYSLGYSVFVFTDEGDCMVHEKFGSSWSASVFKNYKNIYMMYSAMSSKVLT